MRPAKHLAIGRRRVRWPALTFLVVGLAIVVLNGITQAPNNQERYLIVCSINFEVGA
jgi:hypothetical protein